MPEACLLYLSKTLQITKHIYVCTHIKEKWKSKETGTYRLIYIITHYIQTIFFIKKRYFFSSMILGFYFLWNVIELKRMILRIICNRTLQHCKVNKSKDGDLSRGWLEGFLFYSYYTEVQKRALLHSQDCSTLPLIPTL